MRVLPQGGASKGCSEGKVQVKVQVQAAVLGRVVHHHQWRTTPPAQEEASTLMRGCDEVCAAAGTRAICSCLRQRTVQYLLHHQHRRSARDRR